MIRGSTALLGCLIALLAAAHAYGQSDLQDGDAADLAAAIASSASTVRVRGADTPEPSPQRAAQDRIDEIAVVAAALDSDIRTGRSKEETRKLYRRLRVLADQARELTVFQKTEFDPEQSIVFEELLVELDRYYAQ